jgi:hypothetical protein
MSQENDAGSGAKSGDPAGKVFIVPPDGRRFAAELLSQTPAGITLRVQGHVMLFGEQFVAELPNRRALYVVARCELTKGFRWRVEGTFQRDAAEGEKPAAAPPVQTPPDSPPGEPPKPPEDETKPS